MREGRVSPEALLALKVSCFSLGVSVDAKALTRLSDGGKTPVSLHEYPTTGGITFVVNRNGFVNAPFDGKSCSKPEVHFSWDDAAEEYFIRFRNEEFHVEALPLPGYIDLIDAEGTSVRDIVMTHADRLRLSPLNKGCAFGCRFCDLARKKYVKHPIPQVVGAMRVAQADRLLPAHHVLISGGTSNTTDRAYFDDVCHTVLREARMPVDVMMTPRRDSGFVDRYVKWGVYGFALNLEVFDSAMAREITPEKYRLGRGVWKEAIRRAVDLTGGHGRVRSLLVVGLEPLESTLEGVEFLSRLGCDPVLSPFRPSPGIALERLAPPSREFLAELFARATDITSEYGVRLGPRCIPCQHNTLTLPDDSGDYFFS